MPLSYGTLSHLCASIAQESAAAKPPMRCARAGAAAAQSPNAPSTCTQAPAAFACGMILSAGSNAPVLTLPACRQTSVLSSSGGSASARILPWPSTGTRITRSRPRPTSISALSTLTWTSSPTTTLIGGAPNRPCVSTFQPRRASRAWRAAARPEKLAWVAQVTNPTPHAGGSPSTASSQLAATVGGSDPPTTKPKKRPPADPSVAGDPISSSSAITAAGSVGCSGSGSSSRRRLARASRVGVTPRSFNPARYRAARSAVVRRSFSIPENYGVTPLRASPSPGRLVQRRVRGRCVDAPLRQAILRLELRPFRVQHLKKIRAPFAEPQARQLGGTLARGARVLEPLHLEARGAIARQARLHVFHRREDDATVLRASRVLPRRCRIHLRLHPPQVETRPGEHRAHHIAQRPLVAH